MTSRTVTALQDMYGFATLMVDAFGMNGNDAMTDAQHAEWQRVSGLAAVVLDDAENERNALLDILQKWAEWHYQRFGDRPDDSPITDTCASLRG